jgi:hypothetical protein
LPLPGLSFPWPPGLSRPPAGSCERSRAACRVGLATRRAGRRRNRCHPRNQPSGMRWVGCSADSRPASPLARAAVSPPLHGPKRRPLESGPVR